MLHVVKVAAALLRQHSLSKNVGVESNDFYKVILIDKDKDQVDGSLQRIGSCLFENPSEECAEVLGIHRLESWEVRQRYFTCHTTISKKMFLPQTVKFSIDPNNTDSDGKQELTSLFKESLFATLGMKQGESILKNNETTVSCVSLSSMVFEFPTIIPKLMMSQISKSNDDVNEKDLSEPSNRQIIEKPDLIKKRKSIKEVKNSD